MRKKSVGKIAIAGGIGILVLGIPDTEFVLQRYYGKSRTPGERRKTL